MKDIRLVDADYSAVKEQELEIERNRFKGRLYFAGFVLSMVALAVLLMVA